MITPLFEMNMERRLIVAYQEINKEVVKFNASVNKEIEEIQSDINDGNLPIAVVKIVRIIFSIEKLKSDIIKIQNELFKNI